MAAALVALLAAGCAGLDPSPEALKQEFEKLRPEFERTMAIYRPSAEGRRPAALLFHGCSGRDRGFDADHEKEWAEWLNGQGYVAIAFDSLKPRGIVSPDALCQGRRPWGNDRAVDVDAAIRLAKQLSYVDADRIVTLGFSHGGWAVLDELAKAEYIRPRAAIAFYPRCEFPATHRMGWDKSIPTLGIFAENDEVVSMPSCWNVFSEHRKAGGKVSFIVVEKATHVFDFRRHTNRGHRYNEAGVELSKKTIKEFLINHGLL